MSLKNNSQQIVIEVIDDRQKVLIAAAGPHPDLGVLRQSIALNKHNEVAIVMNKELAGIDPGAYGLIILYQLPNVVYANNNFVNESSQVEPLGKIAAPVNSLMATS